MSSLQRQFISPQLMKELQEIFDVAWQEINPLPDDELDGENATQLRNELALRIMSSRGLEPATIRETVLQEIRTGKRASPGMASDALNCGEGASANIGKRDV